jgi:hypothetical protein
VRERCGTRDMVVPCLNACEDTYEKGGGGERGGGEGSEVSKLESEVSERTMCSAGGTEGEWIDDAPLCCSANHSSMYKLIRVPIMPVAVG